ARIVRDWERASSVLLRDQSAGVSHAGKGRASGAPFPMPFASPGMRYDAGMDLAAYFSGKRITVLGLGTLGRAVGDAEFLASQGAELIITDLKSELQLADSVARLSAYPNVTFVLG